DTAFTIQTITDLLLHRYNVDEEAARKDAEELVNIWLTAGIIKK
ncbi:MAG: PqqD family protein, partial [Muribaculaceae bacterium]|nr:PqqD family protein [Muribaculaceae bacterium]